MAEHRQRQEHPQVHRSKSGGGVPAKIGSITNRNHFSSRMESNLTKKLILYINTIQGRISATMGERVKSVIAPWKETLIERLKSQCSGKAGEGQ